MNIIKECFDTILHSNKNDSRLAARMVRKLLYSSQGDRKKYEHIKDFINDAPGEYAKITEEWRQENFVMAISVIYFLHDRENEPDFLFLWLFQLLQHSNGYIRHSAVRMFEHELGPLTYHIRFPNEKSNRFRELSSEQANRILFELYANLIGLINDLWRPVYKKYKYISSLPSGPYKSIQMILGSLEDGCGKEYIAQLEQRLELL